MLPWKIFCEYGKYLHTCDIYLTKDEKHSRKVQNTEQKKEPNNNQLQCIRIIKQHKTMFKSYFI